MYKIKKPAITTLEVNNSGEGERLEIKLERVINNQEPIDNAIGQRAYNERKEGVIASRDIRTDRFEIAIEGMGKTVEMKKMGREEKINKQKLEKNENDIESNNNNNITNDDSDR